jgi:PAS domain S-box-containing protein
MELERLTAELGQLREAHARANEHERVVQELRVHELELELQNRELREAHAALEESRSRYADLYDFAPVAYLTLDPRALILDINLTGATMLGRDRARLLGMPLPMLVKLERPQALMAHLRRCTATRRPTMSELRFTTPERSSIDVQIVSAPVIDAAGRVVAFRTAFTDISERLRIEHELARVTAEENRLRRRSEALDATGVALSNALTRIGIAPTEELLEVVVERARTVMDADYCAIGIGSDPAKPLSPWILFGPEGRIVDDVFPRPTGLLADLNRLGRAVRTADMTTLKSEVHFGAIDSVLRNLLGAPVGFGGPSAGCLLVFNKRSGRDFDSDDESLLQMLAERVGMAMEVARLMEVETRERTGLRSLAESGTALLSTLERGGALKALCRGGLPWLADAGVVHEIDGDVLRAVEVGHVDAEMEAELEKLREREEIACDHPSQLQAQVWRTGEPIVVSGRETLATESTRLDVMVTRADPRSVLIVPIRSRSGIVGTLTLIYSRSGRRHRLLDVPYADGIAQQGALALENARLYEQSRAATRARDDLLAVVSHDLRTPLASIALSAAVLAHPGGNGERRRGRKQVDVILRSTARMGRLIDDLLEAATIEAGNFTVVVREEHPGSIAEEALEALGPIAAQKSVHLHSDVPPDLPMIACDRRRVMQVLSNLVGNAIKFVPPQGRIGLRARALEREVCFSVSDTGPGIVPSEIPRLFDRYWRGSQGGTGLGLYIARGIVEGHGGRISVESRPSEGCTFHFTIPIAERAEEQPVVIAAELVPD